MGIRIEIVDGTVRPITVPATAVDVQLLPGDGYLCNWALRDAQGEISTDAEGSVVAPAAGATIAVTSVLPAGEYTVSWTVSLAGAAAAPELDNFELVTGATVISPSVNPPVAGNYPQPPAVYQLAAAGTFAVKAVGAATAGVTYSAEISVAPASTVSSVFELRDGSRVMGTASMAPNDDSSRSFGAEGMRIYTGLTLHIVQGAVTGSVGCRYNRAS